MLVTTYFTCDVRGTSVPGGIVADLPDADAQALVDSGRAAKATKANGPAQLTIVAPAAATVAEPAVAASAADA